MGQTRDQSHAYHPASGEWEGEGAHSRQLIQTIPCLKSSERHKPINSSYGCKHAHRHIEFAIIVQVRMYMSMCKHYINAILTLVRHCLLPVPFREDERQQSSVLETAY